jgi:hypothetical protein
MKKIAAMTALAVFSVFQGNSAHAVVGDRFNLLAPALLQTDSGNPTVVVRRADGIIFFKQVEPVIQGSWTSLGAPPGGTTSGPQMADFKDSNTNITTTFVVVRGADTNLWATKRSTGAWSAWTKILDAPSTGANSSYTLESDQFFGLEVGVLDNNLFPFMAQASSGGGGTLGAWTKMGDGTPQGPKQLDASFGLAIQPGPQSTIAWGIVPSDGDHIDWSICGFPYCFNGWNNTPGGSAQSGLATTGFRANDKSSTTMVAVRGGDNNVWTNTIKDGGSPLGWQVQSPGGVTDAMPAIARSAFSSGILIVVHRADGNYWFQGNTNLGHP